MMILPELRLAFVHIYKTGGTSLTLLLAPHTWPRFRQKETRLSGLGFQGTWHFKGQQHARFNHPNAGFPPGLQDSLNEYRFLAVVRDPYTWSHSVYKEFFSTDFGDNRGSNFLFGQVKPNRTLEDFHDFARAFKPGHGDMYGLDTQSAFLEGIPKEQLHLIRFEDYDAEVRRVLPSLGVDVDDLPHSLNRGDAKRVEAEALRNNAAHVAFCNEFYREDFEKFGYEMR